MVCSYCGRHIWVYPGETIDDHSQAVIHTCRTPPMRHKGDKAYWYVWESRLWIEIHWYKEDPCTGKLWFLRCPDCKRNPRYGLNWDDLRALTKMLERRFVEV